VGGERREGRVSLGRLRGLYRRFADYVEMDRQGNRVCDLSALAATLAGAESMDVGRQVTGVGKEKKTQQVRKKGVVWAPPPPLNPSAFPTACLGRQLGEALPSRRTHSLTHTSRPRCSTVLSLPLCPLADRERLVRATFRSEYDRWVPLSADSGKLAFIHPSTLISHSLPKIVCYRKGYLLNLNKRVE